MKHREELANLFQEHNANGKGVEIGVMHGGFTLTLANSFNGKVYAVDLWDDSFAFNLCRDRFSGRSNIEMIKGNSIEVAKRFEDNSLDFVYIDAGHSFEEVKADYEAWYPKVRSGGVVAGHDYCDHTFGVKKFMDSLGIKFELTTDDFWDGKAYPSWYFVKK